MLICLSVNIQDTLTGRSELGMQAVATSIIALLSLADARLSSQGEDSVFFVSANQRNYGISLLSSPFLYFS